MAKLVFAHYLIYAPDSLDTYKREIQLAQSKGIDGFGLNTNIWRKQLADNIYEAARQLGTNFKLFFSADIHADSGRLSPDDVVSMLRDYRTHPNQLQYQGKSFFTSWLGNDDGFWSFSGYANAVVAWQDIFKKAGGKNLYYFVPFFPTDGSYEGVKVLVYNRFGSTVDGYYGWESSAWNYLDGNYQTPGLSPGDTDSLKISNERGKTYMASVSPWFFKNLGGDACNSPSCNPSASRDEHADCPCQVKGNYQGPGLWVQKWQQIINNPPPLVQIVSWNDWIEGHYVAPGYSTGAADSIQYVDVAGFPHQAYLELGKYYIDWYKTGREPITSKDSIFLFYYTQSKSVIVPGVSGRILNSDQLSDTLYAAVILSPGNPATVTMKSGGSTQVQTASQGVSVFGMGFFTGTQSVSYVRDSKTFTLTGTKQIRNSNLTKYNFNVYSAWADVP